MHRTSQRAWKPIVKGKPNLIDLVDINDYYVLVNKPSGVQCKGTSNFKSFLLPQLYGALKAYSEQNLGRKVDPHNYKIVHRLDKYVTGGVIVGRRKFAKAISDSFAGIPNNVTIKRRYVGLLPIPTEYNFQTYLQKVTSGFAITGSPSLDELVRQVSENKDKGLHFTSNDLSEGIINHDVVASRKDDRKSGSKSISGPRDLLAYEAITKFKILHLLARPALRVQRRDYPLLFNGKTLYPVVVELVTGRKNQIRDHVIQAFATPLLNDDNFLLFKARTTRGSHPNNVNSNLYKSNQIALHAAYLDVQVGVFKRQYLMPLKIADAYLWTPFLKKDTLIDPIVHSLEHF